jgi:hypothetical protein
MHIRDRPGCHAIRPARNWSLVGGMALAAQIHMALDAVLPCQQQQPRAQTPYVRSCILAVDGIYFRRVLAALLASVNGLGAGQSGDRHRSGRRLGSEHRSRYQGHCEHQTQQLAGSRSGLPHAPPFHLKLIG